MTLVPATEAMSLCLMDGVSLIRIVGDIEVVQVPVVRALLETALEQPGVVIVDLCRTGAIESVALSTLLAASRAARRRGDALLLAAPSHFVRTVLRPRRLVAAFATFDTVPAAMTAALATVHAGRDLDAPAGRH